MKLEPLAAPAIVQPTNTTVASRTAAGQRAIEMIQNGGSPQAQQHPVQNPTQISPEEASAVRSARAAPKDQNSNNESLPPQGQEETKAEEQPLSSRYAALARQERANRLKDQQIRQERATLEAEKAKIAAERSKPTSQFDESKYVSKEDLLRDPIRTLLNQGLTYDQLTEAAINGPSQENMATQNELRALREEMKALKGETENTKKSFEEANTAQRTQAKRQIRADVARLVQVDPAFETIKATRSVGDVVELITKTFDEDGILMTVEEAAQQVEDYLLDEALRLTKLSKVQSRLAPRAPAPDATPKATAQPQQQQMKTLTNSVNASRPLSAKERAILAFENKLKK